LILALPSDDDRLRTLEAALEEIEDDKAEVVVLAVCWTLVVSVFVGVGSGVMGAPADVCFLTACHLIELLFGPIALLAGLPSTSELELKQKIALERARLGEGGGAVTGNQELLGGPVAAPENPPHTPAGVDVLYFSSAAPLALVFLISVCVIF